MAEPKFRLTKTFLGKCMTVYSRLRWTKQDVANYTGYSISTIKRYWDEIESCLRHHQQHGYYGIPGEKKKKTISVKFTSRELVLIKELSLSGFTKSRIAILLQVSRSTLQQWENKFPEVAFALNFGKDHADNKIINALYNRSIGMKVKRVFNALDRESGKIKSKTYEEELAPSVTGCQLWLRNRQNWDKKDTDDAEAEGVLMKNLEAEINREDDPIERE